MRFWTTIACHNACLTQVGTQKKNKKILAWINEFLNLRIGVLIFFLFFPSPDWFTALTTFNDCQWDKHCHLWRTLLLLQMDFPVVDTTEGLLSFTFLSCEAWSLQIRNEKELHEWGFLMVQACAKHFMYLIPCNLVGDLLSLNTKCAPELKV